MKNSMNDVSQRLSLQNRLYYAFFFFFLNNKDNQKKHLQEEQKASRRRAGTSLPWLSQSRSAVLAEERAGWQASLLLSLSRNRRNFTKIVSVLQTSCLSVEKSGLTSLSFFLASSAPLGAMSLAADLTCRFSIPADST